MQSGESGNYYTTTIFITKNTEISIIIGSGGKGLADTTASNIRYGGETKFGKLSSNTYSNGFFGEVYFGSPTQTTYSVQLGGAGFGGGWPYKGTSEAPNKGRWFGAGGGCFYNATEKKVYAGDGYRGAVIIEYYNTYKGK